MELEDREAKHLGSLSRKAGIEKELGRGTRVLNLWRRLLSSAKERYSFKEDAICHPDKQTAVEKGIRYLRELAVLEMIYFDWNNSSRPQIQTNSNAYYPCGVKLY